MQEALFQVIQIGLLSVEKKRKGLGDVLLREKLIWDQISTKEPTIVPSSFDYRKESKPWVKWHLHDFDKPWVQKAQTRWKIVIKIPRWITTCGYTNLFSSCFCCVCKKNLAGGCR